MIVRRRWLHSLSYFRWGHYHQSLRHVWFAKHRLRPRNWLSGWVDKFGGWIYQQRQIAQKNAWSVFPQPTNLYDLTWNEYPNEPCSNHCVMPSRTDRSFARFYLTHSSCLKHGSSLSIMGPWLYLSNRISTLPKLYKSPQISHFITLLHYKLRGDQRVKDYLVACQLVEHHGSYTLLIRVDVYMNNNPLECKSWLQTYNLDDQFSCGERTHYYLHKDFQDHIYDLHVEAMSGH